MDWHTGFISWFHRHIHNMKIIIEMNNKFFGPKKKKNQLLMFSLKCLLVCEGTLCNLLYDEKKYLDLFKALITVGLLFT